MNVRKKKTMKNSLQSQNDFPVSSSYNTQYYRASVTFFRVERSIHTCTMYVTMYARLLCIQDPSILNVNREQTKENK